ncbi:beta-ketoacyl synthase chain length factor [Cognatilysobacter bugurensis]|uniref:Beta-ketoacyl synthase-like N-terminal domain-containing protein n=1 Tax=Cognatilysobacter bugurensis TaxID=543356 RepID=A0A918T3H7_9GAMM|nr:beta-ketoacyl synthase chain length factor [Lysobacter bugurensis]GHA82036.1 hypothetical protein GCM10007067_19930 [Lysobacter bugurensis]
MTALSATVEGIGFWTRGMPGWDAARAFVQTGARIDDAPSRPSPQLLAPNERRRAPDTVAVALDVALAACAMAGRDPASLPSVFASTHGDLTITDYICATLASAPATVSPIRFHNSVHNAAAGYWTIGAGATRASTAISAFDASFAQGLLDALAQISAGAEGVLLVGFDGASAGPLAQVSQSSGLLGGALVLARDAKPGAPRLRATLADGEPDLGGALATVASGNAMAPMLPLFETLAGARAQARLLAGPGRVLQVEVIDV